MSSLTDKINIHAEIQLFIRKDYLNHPFISGNKLRKLKYNLEEAKSLGINKLVTFGGPYSNHILAVACAGKTYGFETIGIIRGEEFAGRTDLNPTLNDARNYGMRLRFISRQDYKRKSSEDFISALVDELGACYLLPEGGTNDLAVKGCEEILTEDDRNYDFICCPVGTGGTISGIINSSFKNQKILGFPALKGDFLREEISKFARRNNWDLILDYHFGGYAKVNSELIAFLNSFNRDNNIPLDPVYTGKMMYGVHDLIHKGYFPDQSRILVIHTGGLQGVRGMNTVLSQKGLPLIQY